MPVLFSAIHFRTCSTTSALWTASIVLYQVAYFATIQTVDFVMQTICICCIVQLIYARSTHKQAVFTAPSLLLALDAIRITIASSALLIHANSNVFPVTVHHFSYHQWYSRFYTRWRIVKMCCLYKISCGWCWAVLQLFYCFHLFLIA